MRLSRKKIEIIFKKRSFVIPVGETVVSEHYVYPLGYFLALRFELTLYLSANQGKETQANTKHIQSSINRLLKEMFFSQQKDIQFNLDWFSIRRKKIQNYSLMILSKYYILNKFHSNPFSSKVLFNVIQVFLEGMGFVSSLIGRLGAWYPVKGTDLSISDCHHA